MDQDMIITTKGINVKMMVKWIAAAWNDIIKHKGYSRDKTIKLDPFFSYKPSMQSILATCFNKTPV